MPNPSQDAPPRQVDTLVRARWVAPVEPDCVPRMDHVVVVHGDRIVDLLPEAEALARYVPRETVDLPEHLLIPGLVNAHTHAAMTLFRGLADDRPLMDWLHNHIWPAEMRWAGPEFVRDGARLAAAEMLKGGITTFGDMYFFPDETARAAAEAHIRAVVGLIVIDFPTPWASGPDEYFSKGAEVHDAYRHHPLVRTAYAPHAPYTVSDASLARIAMLAEELDVPVHMHVHETAEEVERAVAERGERPLARLDRLGLVSNRLAAVHVTQTTPDERARLAACGVHVVHCPESNLKLASGYCPVATLQAAGVDVALGTDGAASNNDLDMLGEMRTAALLGKAVAGDPASLPAADALRMATLMGARALGLDEITGSLVPGKSADMAAIDLSRVATQPVYDPVSTLVYAASRDQVTDVWVRGRRVLAGGRLTTLDETSVLARARAWAERIRSA